MSNLLEKKGWYWEDTLIEESVPIEHFSVEVNETFTDINDLLLLEPGYIHLDMQVWGQADLTQYDENLYATGLWGGVYEVYVAYFQSNGNVGQVTRAVDLDGYITELVVPTEAGPQTLKMNAYILPFDINYQYIFNDKAQGIHVYLKHIVSYDPIAWPITNDLLHICELNFEHGWKKIGDAVGSTFQELGKYKTYLPIVGSEFIAPNILSFSGGVGPTSDTGESSSPFEFYSHPMITFYASHGYGHDGLDKYRFKTATIHRKKAYIGNTAKIKTKLDDDGLPHDDWGKIFETNPDRMHRSAVRIYDNFPDHSWIDIITNDGDEIVAVKRFADFIFQFKKNKIYIISTGSGVHALVDTINMGIHHEASCCLTPHGICFLNKKGVYLHTGQGLANLSKESLDLAKYWYDETYYDIDYLIPALIYSTKEDKLVLFMQTFGNGDTQEWLINNPPMIPNVLGLPDNDDTGITSPMSNTVDDFYTEAVLGVLYDDRDDSVLFYNFPTASWTNSKSTTLGGHKSNPVEFKGDICVYNVESNSLIKWDRVPQPQRIDIQTKFNTFQYPNIRKKIKNVTITWKLNKGASTTMDPQVRLRLYKDKSDTAISLSTDDIIEGASIISSEMLFDSGSSGTDGADTFITKVKIPSSDNKVYSLSIRISTRSHTYFETQSSFELKDISVIYQYMGVK